MAVAKAEQTTTSKTNRLVDALEAATLFFVVPFASELKIAWVFAAVPLHFQANSWPLTAFGATISAGTLLRVPMNAAITAAGDHLIVPILMLATASAACMVAYPQNLPAVVAGVIAGHFTATDQVQANLCYRLRATNGAAQKRGLRLQAFSSTFGYSSGAFLGGALYEHAGFEVCAVVQLALLGAMTATSAMLPIIHASFREGCCRRAPRDGAGSASSDDIDGGIAGSAEGADAVSVVVGDDNGCGTLPAAAAEERLTVRGTTDRLLRPVSMIWLSDGFNIAIYVTEWSLFAVYFSDAYQWSSTLTGAAQSAPSRKPRPHSTDRVHPLTQQWPSRLVCTVAGDLLAAGVLALTTTPLWTRLLRYRGATHHFDRLVLQPPWNLCAFFVAFAATFLMLAQPTFAVSVLGQVAMGTVFVFARQAVAEAYLILSHGHLPLFRKLEFVGHVAYNLSMSGASFVAVLVYEGVGMTAPFYAVAVLAAGWAIIFGAYFALRLRGRLTASFATAEAALLAARGQSGTGGAAARTATEEAQFTARANHEYA